MTWFTLVGAVTEDDRAMKVVATRRAGPFEAMKRRKDAWLIPFFRCGGACAHAEAVSLLASKTGLPLCMEITASMAAFTPS